MHHIHFSHFLSYEKLLWQTGYSVSSWSLSSFSVVSKIGFFYPLLVLFLFFLFSAVLIFLHFCPFVFSRYSFILLLQLLFRIHYFLFLRRGHNCHGYVPSSWGWSWFNNWNRLHIYQNYKWVWRSMWWVLKKVFVK